MQVQPALRARVRSRLRRIAGRPLAGEELLAQYPATDIAGVPAAVVKFDAAVYFVPHYAADRPVARRILRKTYV